MFHQCAGEIDGSPVGRFRVARPIQPLHDRPQLRVNVNLRLDMLQIPLILAGKLIRKLFAPAAAAFQIATSIAGSTDQGSVMIAISTSFARYSTTLGNSVASSPNIANARAIAGSASSKRSSRSRRAPTLK